jgi:hypothetical protein
VRHPLAIVTALFLPLLLLLLFLLLLLLLSLLKIHKRHHFVSVSSRMWDK